MTTVTHRPTIRTVYQKLDRAEPFNDIERAQYNEKEQALIRGIQLRDKEDKQQAIQTYTNYQMEGRKATKSLASSIRNYVKSKYPKQGGAIHHEVSEFERAKPKKELRRENKVTVFNFLKDRKHYEKNPDSYMRVKNGSRKYPNASVTELRHGVNSKYSQEWRVNHGLTREYK